MTGQLATFTFQGSSPVRTLMRDNEPWFVAADVCAVLEHSNAREAIRCLDEDEKGVSITDTPGGPQSLNLISESGLYALIMRSRKPLARAFRRWVTGEVLPALRKHGCYEVASSARSRPVLGLGKVRALWWKGQPWVASTDFLVTCGYSPFSNLMDRIPDHLKGTARLDTPGGEQRVRVVSMAGIRIFAETAHARFRGALDECLRWMSSLTAKDLPQIHVSIVDRIQIPASEPLYIQSGDERADFARKAVEYHAHEADLRDLRFAHESNLTHLLADLMHLSDHEGLDFEVLLTHARHHYHAERLRTLLL